MPNHTQEEWDALLLHATDLAYATLTMQRELRFMRETQGLTQQDVADKLGTNRFAIDNIEAGDPTLSELRQYALAVGANITYEVKEYTHDSTHDSNASLGIGDSSIH